MNEQMAVEMADTGRVAGEVTRRVVDQHESELWTELYRRRNDPVVAQTVLRLMELDPMARQSHPALYLNALERATRCQRRDAQRQASKQAYAQAWAGVLRFGSAAAQWIKAQINLAMDRSSGSRPSLGRHEPTFDSDDVHLAEQLISCFEQTPELLIKRPEVYARAVHTVLAVKRKGSLGDKDKKVA